MGRGGTHFTGPFLLFGPKNPKTKLFITDAHLSSGNDRGRSDSTSFKNVFVNEKQENVIRGFLSVPFWVVRRSVEFVRFTVRRKRNEKWGQIDSILSSICEEDYLSEILVSLRCFFVFSLKKRNNTHFKWMSVWPCMFFLKSRFHRPFLLSKNPRRWDFKLILIYQSVST